MDNVIRRVRIAIDTPEGQRSMTWDLVTPPTDAEIIETVTEMLTWSTPMHLCSQQTPSAETGEVTQLGRTPAN